jgi:GTP-binding protein
MKMKINNPEYILSAVYPKDYPFHHLPEIALAGRSNVGKSSLINKVVNRKKMAFTSSKPGKTQTINFYQIDNYFYFVDLPGYGFARVSKEEKEEWGRMIESYLIERENLEALLLVVDARHKPTQDDIQMFNWILQMNMPAMVVATKVDKIKNSQKKKQERLIKETLGISQFTPFTFFSTETGEGKDKVIQFIGQFMD